MERGTLYQLRNLIDRRNVTTKVKSEVNAAEDFLETVVVGYVISAVMVYLNMASLEDVPDTGQLKRYWGGLFNYLPIAIIIISIVR